eukprot:3480341-Pyramimonas_sp.AAC.2
MRRPSAPVVRQLLQGTGPTGGASAGPPRQLRHHRLRPGDGRPVRVHPRPMNGRCVAGTSVGKHKTEPGACSRLY